MIGHNSGSKPSQTNTTNADLVEDAIASIPNVDLVKVKAHAEAKCSSLNQVRETISWEP